MFCDMASGNQRKPPTDRARASAEMARHIRDAMTKAGRTQVWLEEQTGIPQSHISAMLNGRRSIGPHHLKQFALALDLDASKLIAHGSGGSETTPQPAVGGNKAPESRSVPDRSLPPGLKEFLDEEGEFISPWERERLVDSAFNQRNPRIEFDRVFWRRMLEFWREELRRQRGSGGPGGETR
jgi:transcriptional regulator with XRE-family HTH domain